MNKRFKTLLTAGLVTVMAGSSIVSSSALSKNINNINKPKTVRYICVNGVKYKLPLGDNSTNTGNNGNTSGNTGNNGNTSNNTGNNSGENSDNNTTSNSFLSMQKEVVRLVNVERTKRGLKELTFNSQLSNVATLKSQDMINKNYFDHTSPTYGSPFDMMKKFNISYKTAGENIAMGQKSAAEVVKAWMNSEGHRANILNANFTEIGVGIAKNSKGSLYWTQMFIGK